MSSPRVLTVLQSRLGSTRLPGKLSLPLGKGNILTQMVSRVKASKLAGTVLVACTTDAIDDPIVEWCEAINVDCFRGHPTDLLDRHVKAARQFEADVVVKIPSDCPLIDPAVIDRVIGAFLEGGFDFVTNLRPQSYPDGNDVEVMSISAIERAFREATQPIEREHTTPYLWGHPELFRIRNILWETGQDCSRDYRVVLDYQADYEVISRVFEGLSGDEHLFTVGEVVAFLDAHPEVKRLNEHLLGDSWTLRHMKEIESYFKAEESHG